jgi:phosphoribosylanthranilate isomerase
MPKIKIKASSIANLTDARYFAAMMVDYMGYQLDLSHDERLSAAEFHGIKAWVEGPEIVAQVGKTPKSLFAEVYSAEDYQWVSCDIDNRDYDDSKVIAEFRPKSIQDLAHQTFQTGQIYQLHLEDIPEQTLYQGALLSELCAQHQVFISAPSLEQNIRTLIEDIQPYGIDILGGAEEKVGFKSYEELDVFFEHLEIYG